MYSVPKPLSGLRAANYGSNISAQAPFSQSQTRQMSTVQSPMMPSVGLNAAMRGMGDMKRNTLDRDTEQFQRQYRQQAESARSADVFARRQDAARNYDLMRGVDLSNRRLTQRKEQGMADIANEMRIRNAQAKQARFGNMLDLGFSAAAMAINPTFGVTTLLRNLVR